MTGRINTYFAVLLVTVAGAGAASLILHVAFDNQFTKLAQDNTALQLELQSSAQSASR